MLAEPTTMTSLDAQSQFGRLVDMSMRKPVAITRRGRPAAVLISYEDYAQVQYQLARLQSLLNPLRGKAAVEHFRDVTKPIGEYAVSQGLTEEKLMALLNEK